MGKLDGKVALITGASEGIGLATAQKFLDEGAGHVFITGRRQEMLDEAVKKLNSDKVTSIQADQSNLTDIDKVYAIIKEQKGRLDILFVSAGASEPCPLGSITEEHFDTIFNVNVKGILFTVQKALPIFSDGGSIIINGTALSIRGYPAYSVYSASKAAVRSFVRTWTLDLKERRIRVNVVSPGAIETAAYRAAAANHSLIEKIIEAIPLNRIGKPEEIASAVIFLACDDSSYITGVELFVDGGMSQI